MEQAPKFSTVYFRHNFKHIRQAYDKRKLGYSVSRICSASVGWRIAVIRLFCIMLSCYLMLSCVIYWRLQYPFRETYCCFISCGFPYLPKYLRRLSHMTRLLLRGLARGSEISSSCVLLRTYYGGAVAVVVGPELYVQNTTQHIQQKKDRQIRSWGQTG